METKMASIEVDIIRDDLPPIRKNSAVKIGYDVWLLFKKLPYLFDVFGGPGPLSVLGRHELDEFYFSMNPFDLWKMARNLIAFTMNVFLAFQDVLFLLGLFCLFSPFALLAPFLFISTLPLILYSSSATYVVESSKKNTYPNEKWFLLNGISTPLWWHAQNGRRAERMFKRPVNLIHKRSKGVLLDMLGCMINRSYNTVSEPVLATKHAIKEALLNDNHRKVVLLAHCSGGVVASIVVDLLLKDKDLSDRKLHKLEIYTFGSAADEMKGGFVSSRRLSHIEHYINSHDYVAQTGITEYKRLNQAHYSGLIFKAYQKGHFFNQHYSHLLERRAYTNRRGAKSRLYDYLRGGTPSDKVEIEVAVFSAE
jgi:hypothetical protein